MTYCTTCGNEITTQKAYSTPCDSGQCNDVIQCEECWSNDCCDQCGEYVCILCYPYNKCLECDKSFCPECIEICEETTCEAVICLDKDCQNSESRHIVECDLCEGLDCVNEMNNCDVCLSRVCNVCTDTSIPLATICQSCSLKKYKS